MTVNSIGQHLSPPPQMSGTIKRERGSVFFLGYVYFFLNCNKTFLTLTFEKQISSSLCIHMKHVA